jgi:hypothetical protein
MSTQNQINNNNNNNNNNNISINHNVYFEISNSGYYFSNENNNNNNNNNNIFINEINDSSSDIRISTLFNNNSHSNNNNNNNHHYNRINNNRHIFQLPVFHIIPLRRRERRRIRFENINYINNNRNDNNNFYYINNLQRRKKFLEILSNIKIQKKYGILFVNTLKNLLQKNIFLYYKFHIYLLYNQFCYSYLHLKEKYKESKYIIFFECLPKFKNIIFVMNKIKKNFNDKNNFKEIFFIKIMLDLYDDHLNNFDFDADKILINEFYLTSILFYNLLSEENLKKIYQIIKKLDIEFYSLKNNKKYSQMNLIEYQDYFIKNKKIYENLIGGINKKEGLFIQ